MIHVKLTIMALLWAGAFIAARTIAFQAGPFTIAFLRFFLATVVLTVGMKREDKVPMNFKLLLYALGAAFLGVFCYNYLFFTGMKYVEAGRGSVIMSTVPFVVALISHFLFKEKATMVKSSGIMVSFIGAGIVISQGQAGSFLQHALGRGEICLMAGVFCAAAFTFFSKEMLYTLSPRRTIVYISAIGTAFLFLPALIEMNQRPLALVSYSFLLNVLYLAVGPSAIAAIFYYEAIRVVGASRASQYMNLIPFFAVVLAIVFLGERVTPSLLVGGSLVTAGLCLSNMYS